MRNAHVDGTKSLCDCVSDAIDAYFAALDGHETAGLYQMVLREVERPLLQRVLAQTSGNQSVAAQILGLSRGTLRKKLKEHGLC
ncbi:MAG: Fis family transcriptional regulator [Gammaproteobacteria bacterium]|nr:Fis family transcriptional regulator [Gammaproteobacteria bacterium]